jgi:hypothetical protein
MNQVHSELQLARGLIDEKDSEIQRIRVSNNQVCCLATKGSTVLPDSFLAWKVLITWL